MIFVTFIDFSLRFSNPLHSVEAATAMEMIPAAEMIPRKIIQLWFVWKAERIISEEGIISTMGTGGSVISVALQLLQY